MKGSSCISAEELILYREGRITGKRSEVVGRHLERCLLCLDALLYVDDKAENKPAKLPPNFMKNFMKNLNRIAREAWQDTSVKRFAAGGKSS
jgi:hypothetical protein